MRLSWLVIRVLPEDHDAHRLRRRQLERGEQLFTRRKNGLRLIGRVHPLRQRGKIRLFQFFCQQRPPGLQLFQFHNPSPTQFSPTLPHNSSEYKALSPHSLERR